MARRDAPSSRDRASIWAGIRVDAYDDIVEGALVRYLRVPRDAVRGSDALEDDLGLDRLDLAHVVHSLARLAGRAFPFENLDGVETVEQLTGVVRAWACRRD